MRVRSLALAVALALGGLVVPPAVRTAHADPTVPVVTIGDLTVVEGDQGSAVVTLPVDLSEPSTMEVSVRYTVTSTQATPYLEFTPKPKPVLLRFLAGVTTKKISIRVYGDTDIENDEAINVQLTDPVNAQLADDSLGQVTVHDDDADNDVNDPNTALEVSIGEMTVTEADGGKHVASVPVTLSRPAPSTVKVYYERDCANFDPDGTFVGKSTGTLTFLANQRMKVLNFRITPDQSVDAAVTLLRDLKVTLGPATVNEGVGGLTVIDNDGTPPEQSPPDALPPLAPGGLERISVNSLGEGAHQPDPGVCNSSDYGSYGASISADGRYVAFISEATNLVPGDTNEQLDVFVRDRMLGTTERVSVASDGSEPTRDVTLYGPDSAAISADGRYVTWHEYRSIGGYPAYQPYIHDRVTHATEPLMQTLSGGVAGGISHFPLMLSTDDRYFAYSACGDSSGVYVPVDLDPPPPPNSGSACDVFRYDRTTNTSELVSAPPDGSPSDGDGPVISGDGRYVGFVSSNPGYVSGDTNGCPDYFVKDMLTGTFERITVTPSEDTNCAQPGGLMMMSDDGRYVSFAAAAAPDWIAHVYVRDRLAGTTTMVDHNQASWPTISRNGAWVGYICSSCDDVLTYQVIEVATGNAVRASELPDGTLGDENDYHFESWGSTMSADGRYLAFSTRAANLAPDDDNSVPDIYVKRVY